MRVIVRTSSCIPEIPHISRFSHHTFQESAAITPSKMAALSKRLDRRIKIPSQLNVRMTKDILAGSRRQLLLSFRLPFLFISFRILPSPSPTSHLCNNLLSREVLQMAADHSAAILAYLSVSSVVSYSCITILICLSTSSYSQPCPPCPFISSHVSIHVQLSSDATCTCCNSEA